MHNTMQKQDSSPAYQHFFNIKTIIFTTLAVVIILHLVSFLPGLRRSLKEYQLAKQVHYLNGVSDSLFTAVGNYGFERGRVNVVLNDAGPVELMEDNRRFILARRAEGDKALGAALAKLKVINNAKHSGFIDEINSLTEKIVGFREEAAEDLVAPLHKRKAGFAKIWFSAMTQYINSIEDLLIVISSGISDADGIISRYSSIKYETLALRNTAGPEMSILSATMLSGAPLKPEMAQKISSLQISTKHHFHSLAHYSHPLLAPQIPQALEKLEEIYDKEYFPYREEIFPLALRGGPYPYSQSEFLSHGVKALREIAAFMDTVVEVTKDYAEKQLVESKKQITIQLVSILGSFGIIALIFFYVHYRVIKPIGQVTFSLRRLAESDLDVEVPLQDVADEIGDMARAAEVFKKMAIQLGEDVVALRRAEEKIRVSEERFRTVADFAYDWEYWIDPEGKLQYISPSCERITGYLADEFLLDPTLLARICVKEDIEIVERHINVEQLENEPATSLDFRICRKDGEIRWINHICQTIIGKEGIFLGRRACNRDITARKKLEKELITAKKLEATATLAGGIAHDFNNLLTAILGNIELARVAVGQDNEGKDFLDGAHAASLRARDLTSKFITFSSGGAPVKKQTDINEFIGANTSLLLSGTNVRLETKIPTESWQVDLDQSQISQVLSNIVVNAKEAMPEGGSLILTIENLNSLESEKTFQTTETGKKYVKISFVDEGIGISKANIGKVFDPYYSTKERGAQKGMGLGLTVSHSIISKHDGYMTIQSNQARGTKVSIFLPVSSQAVSATSNVEPHFRTNSGDRASKKVLFMDDEEMVRDFVSTILIQHGFICETVKDGCEALEKYREWKDNGNPFDIAIMDLTVPGGMGGVKAVKELLEIEPTAKVIVASGYSSDPVMNNFANYGFSGAIVKPFQSSELLALIRRL